MNDRPRPSGRLKAWGIAATLIAGGCDAQPPAAPAPPPKPAAATPQAPAPPPPPKAPEISAETRRAHVAALGQCSTAINCPHFEAVVGYGADVKDQLLELALNPKTPPRGREVAVAALSQSKDPATALRLHTAAKAETNFSLRRAYYAGVAAIGAGDDAVFEVLKADYLITPSAVARIPIEKALAAFPTQVMPWVKAAFAAQRTPAKTKRSARAKKGSQPVVRESGYANIVQLAARPEDAQLVSELVVAAKEPMARHRLAAKAIALGQTQHFEVLYDGLKAKKAYDRSDAANQLATVCDQIPADQRARFTERLQAAEKTDKGGLTKRGYHLCLKTLRRAE